MEYWDYLGWKDTFGSKDHTVRQTQYVKTVQGDPYYRRGSKYTPNAVTDGAQSGTGTNRKQLEQQLRKAMAEPALVELTPEAGLEDRALTLKVKTRAAKGAELPSTLRLHAVLVRNNLEVKIAGGELAGKKLTYHHVASRWLEPVAFEVKEGSSASFELKGEIDAGWDASKLEAVVFVQDAETMKVWQAARIALRP